MLSLIKSVNIVKDIESYWILHIISKSETNCHVQENAINIENLQCTYTIDFQH